MIKIPNPGAGGNTKIPARLIECGKESMDVCLSQAMVGRAKMFISWLKTL